MTQSQNRGYAFLQDNQCIVRVIQFCAPNVVVIVTPKGFKHLVSIPEPNKDSTDERMSILPGAATEERMKILPGNYVLIQATEDGSRYPAEIIRVIDHEDEKFYRIHNLWPTAYDVEGYVERLAERVQRAEAAAEVEAEEERILELKRLKKKQKKEKLTSVLNSTSSMLCEKYMQLKEHLKDKMLKYGKEGVDYLPGCDPSSMDGSCSSKRKALLDPNKKLCKSDKDCIADSPLFVDTDYPVHCVDVPNDVKAHSSTNTQSNCGTNTMNVIQPKSYKINRVLEPLSGGGSGNSFGCCSKSCGGAKLSQSTGSGPCYSDLTVGRDQLPPLYGKCTPWRMSRKELKRKCDEYQDSLFTAINKNPCP